MVSMMMKNVQNKFPKNFKSILDLRNFAFLISKQIFCGFPNSKISKTK